MDRIKMSSAILARVRAFFDCMWGFKPDYLNPADRNIRSFDYHDNAYLFAHYRTKFPLRSDLQLTISKWQLWISFVGITRLGRSFLEAVLNHPGDHTTLSKGHNQILVI